jgi:FkbM family methyltransferase
MKVGRVFSLVLLVGPSVASTNIEADYDVSLFQNSLEIKELQTQAEALPDEPAEVLISEPAHAGYRLDLPNASFAQWGQDMMIFPLFQGKTDGFFVEAGAVDGEYLSNSLLFEMKGWSGLLVEPNALQYKKLTQKRRNAYTFHGALSISNRTEGLTLFFDPAQKDTGAGWDSISDYQSYTDENVTEYTVPAVPIATLMSQLNRTTIDFWSLDVEGAEPGILENVDFQKLEIGVLCIEMNLPIVKHAEHTRIRAVLDRAGFKEVGAVYYPGHGEILTQEDLAHKDQWVVLDRVFANPRYFEDRGLEVPTKLANGPF